MFWSWMLVLYMAFPAGGGQYFVQRFDSQADCQAVGVGAVAAGAGGSSYVCVPFDYDPQRPPHYPWPPGPPPFGGHH